MQEGYEGDRAQCSRDMKGQGSVHQGHEGDRAHCSRDMKGTGLSAAGT